MSAIGTKSQRVEEEGESIFVSMTDLTISFLFILLVLLAFFANHFKIDDLDLRSEREKLEQQLHESKKSNNILEKSLSNQRQKRQLLEQEQREFIAQKAAADLKIAKLNSLVDTLCAGIEKSAIHIEVLSEQIEALQHELKATEKTLQNERELTANLKNQVKDTKEKVTECLQKLYQLREQDSLASYLDEAFKQRERLLKQLKNRIEKQIPGIQVTVHDNNGIIRFRADELFKPGEWRIIPNNPAEKESPNKPAEKVSHAISEALIELLPCYTLSPIPNTEVSCKGPPTAIETIQIEGHTDYVPLGPTIKLKDKMIDNYDLSARRAAETLRVMIQKRRELEDFRNLRRQRVLSFAGYGKDRPVNNNEKDTKEARAQNRRIDIRFILHTPRNLQEVEEIRSKLIRHRNGLLPIIE